MGLVLLESALPSRVAKAALKALKDLAERAEKEKSGGGKLLETVKRTLGMGFRAFGKFLPKLNVGDLWGSVVNAYFVIKHFDWNATDKSLQDTIESNNKAIVSAAATALGTSLGWSVVRLANLWTGRMMGDKSGAAAAQNIKIPVLSARIGLALAEEGNEEIRSSVYQFLATARQAIISNTMISAVLFARRNEWLGMSSVTTPQADGSIASRIEEQIEKLPEFWRQPAENLIDSFEDAILDAGYVVAYQIDDHVAAMRAAQADQPVRTIEVTFKDSDEKIEFSGPQELVKQATINALATRDLLNDRDVGQILGSPLTEEDWNPKFQVRQLKIIFSSRDKPPLWIEPEQRSSNHKTGSAQPDKKRKKARRAEVTIPDVKPGVSWGDIKGAARVYQRGNHLVRMMLESGHEIQIWAGTPAEGQRVLTQLAGLSNCKPLAGTIRAEEVLDLDPSRKKPLEHMYPVQYVLLNRKNKTKGKGQFDFDDKQYDQEIKKVDLWPTTAPEGVKPIP